MMEHIRIIKKYSNRRLYDTHVSQYIKLDGIKELVAKQIAFKVVDADTEEDKTNYVLLQIISESESTQLPIFTTEILQNIIRFYGNPLQKITSQFLEKSFSILSNQQNKDPIDVVADLTKKNMTLWQGIFNDYAEQSAKPARKKKSKKTKTKKPV